MKKLAVLVSLIAICLFTTSAFAADKAAISKNVDMIVAGIDGGKAAASFNANDYTPYVFIFQEAGPMLVHPSLIGKNLKEIAPAIYNALVVATADGVWVEYEWKGKTKHTYAKKTKGNEIVASGY